MNPLVECLGWTLVHFLWQGAAIALLLAVGLRLLRRGPSSHRYLAGCAALLLMVIAPGITFQIIEQRLQPSPQPVVEPVSIAPQAVEITPRPAATAPKVIFTAKPVVPGRSVAQRLEMLLPWLVVGWSIGVLALSCRLLVGWLQIKRLQLHAIEALAEPWHEKLAELAQCLGLDRPVRLFQSALIEVPTVIGWLRPVILLPASCLVGLTPAQLESILAHELAHIRRHDYLVNLLQSMVETLLFYHPAVWWVSRRIREERENSCDDIAVKICGDPVAYARALATLEEMRPASAQLSLAASGGPLLQRIQRLLGASSSSTSSPSWPLAGVIIAIMIITLATNLRGNHALAAETLTPETFLTGLGVYHYTNDSSALELTIRSNQLLLSASDDSHHTSAGVNTWNPGRHWFLYMAKGRQVWAYDGNSGLWLLRADLLTGSGSESIGWLREPPPAAVVKRLPKAVVQRLPTPLETRKFQLNPKRFVKTLEAAGFSPRDVEFNDDSKSAAGEQVSNGDSNRQSMKLQLVIRQFLMSHEVTFAFDTLLDGQNNLADTNAPTHGKTFYYDEAAGKLFVRSTSQELDKVSSILAAINNGKQPDTKVETKTEGQNERPAQDSHREARTETLTDGNSSVALAELSSGKDIWPVDGQNEVSQDWFYYRIGNSGTATSGKSQLTAVPADASSSSPSAKDDSELLIRTYPLDINALLESMNKTTGIVKADRQSMAEQALQEYFTKAGVDLHSINSTNTNDRSGYILNIARGMLLVHARKADLGKISALVAKLAPKPAINIKVKFVEIDETASHTKGFDWILKDSLENLAEPAPKVTWSHTTTSFKSIGWPNRMASNSITPQSLGVTKFIDLQYLRVTNAIDLQLSSILTDPQFHVAIETLEKHDGVDELTAPEVTTESGRQAQIQAVDLQTVVVGPCATNAPQTEIIPIGPTLDVIPSALNDGYSIEVKGIATVTEFLGYEVPGKRGGNPELVLSPTKPVSVAIPVIRLRQMAFGATVHDGQTIVMGGTGPETVTVVKDKVPVLGDIPLVGRLFRSQSSGKSRKNLLVFVTPTLINPDGTRYHSKKEMADVRFLVPSPQPSISQKAN